MADEIRVTARGGAEADATTPGAPRPATAPQDPEAARAEIQATRARMSETIDEIEEVLLRKKEQIQDRLDLLAPVREQPLRTLGAIFGAGLLLGLLTGGGEEEDEDLDELRAHRAWERADTWEDRARRLLRIAQEQEAELEMLRSGYDGHDRAVAAEADEDEDGDSIFQRLGNVAADRISGYVADAIYRMFRG